MFPQRRNVLLNTTICFSFDRKMFLESLHLQHEKKCFTAIFITVFFMHFLCSLIIYLQVSIYSNCCAKISGEMRGGGVWEGEIPGLIFWFPLLLKREGRPANFSERIFLRVYSTFGIQVVQPFFFFPGRLYGSLESY